MHPNTSDKPLQLQLQIQTLTLLKPLSYLQLLQLLNPLQQLKSLHHRHHRMPALHQAFIVSVGIGVNVTTQAMSECFKHRLVGICLFWHLNQPFIHFSSLGSWGFAHY